jgi:hypothetical protein
MMTGHEAGATLGVATLTATGGDRSTRAGLIAGCPDAFAAVAVILLALLIPTVLIPRAAGGGTAAGHGHH